MEKLAMREKIAELETRADTSLWKWKKSSRIENGEVVQIAWQFEQAHVILDMFWHDDDEHVNLECRTPRMHSMHEWKGFSESVYDNVMDRIGNFAQVAQSLHS